MKKWLFLLLLAVPAEAVETITVVAKNKEKARYNAVWAANMKCNRKGFWAEPSGNRHLSDYRDRKVLEKQRAIVIKTKI